MRMSEAKKKVQAAEREVALLQERIQEEAEEWQRDCEAQIAAMQVEAWENASVDLGGYMEPRMKSMREADGTTLCRALTDIKHLTHSLTLMSNSIFASTTLNFNVHVPDNSSSSFNITHDVIERRFKD